MNSINHVLQTADREGYAVPAFNYSDIWEMEGIVEAAAEERATVYIASNMRVAETVGLPYLGAMGRTAYEQTGGHIINHLDHSSSVELCKQAVDCGYMSVMIDASMCPLEENIAKTREVVEYAHKYGVVVEAEIGRILGRNVEGTYEGDEYLVQVADAVRMAEETGVDSLAVGIGTAHGFYKEAPRINIQRLVEVNAAVCIQAAADLGGTTHMLALHKYVLPLRLHHAVAVEIVGQCAVAGAGGALLRDIVQRCIVAAIGGAVVAKAEHMDAGNVIPSGQRRYRRLVLDGAQQRITVPDGHHDIGKAGGDDGGQQPLRTVIRRLAVGLV